MQDIDTIITEKVDAYFAWKYGRPWVGRGMVEEKIEIAHNMKNDGVDMETITKYTRLTAETMAICIPPIPVVETKNDVYVITITNANKKTFEELIMQGDGLPGEMDAFFIYHYYIVPWIAWGRSLEKADIACTMKNDGIDLKTVSKYTGLSTDEIERLG